MSDSILLKGLDGSNPLAFLAALGTLRTLTVALPDETVRMSWEQADGAWRPRVWYSLANDGEAIIEKLHNVISAKRNTSNSDEAALKKVLLRRRDSLRKRKSI